MTIARANIKKTKYDTWLEEWNKPLTPGDFGHLASEDENDASSINVRKTLRILKNYLSGNAAVRFFTGKWHHHHCEEITALLAAYAKPAERPAYVDTFAKQRSSHHERDDSVTELLNRPGTRQSGLGLQLLDSKHTDVRVLLEALESRIAHSQNKIIKEHGDLFAILQVIRDYAGIDYFTLRKGAEDQAGLNY